MNPDILWSNQLAAEQGTETGGLIWRTPEGLFCLEEDGWTRLAAMPDDVVQLGLVGEQ